MPLSEPCLTYSSSVNLIHATSDPRGYPIIVTSDQSDCSAAEGPRSPIEAVYVVLRCSALPNSAGDHDHTSTTKP